MSNRISTLTFQTNAVSQMQALQAALAQTQQQLSTGKKLLTAADNPTGMAQVNQMNLQLSASQQYVTNGNAVSSNLKIESQGLQDAINLMQSARDLAVQANSSALSTSQRQDIAIQLQQQLNDLIAIGNRTDSNGSYIFGGYASGIQPFTQSGTTVSYNGSNLVSQVQISANQSLSSGDTGATVFMNIPAGNGTFTTSAAATNTGTAAIGVGTVTQSSAWVPDTYTIAFTTPGQYQITDSAGTVVSSGAYTDGDTISFNGIGVTLTGTPATGDQFTVAPAGTSSAFNTLSSLIATLNNPNLSNAQLNTQISGALQQIDGAVNNFTDVAASVGTRLNSVTAAQTTAQSVQTTLTASISQITDVDYAAATTQLSTLELSLQAAQASYGSIAKLSLFNYLQ